MKRSMEERRPRRSLQKKLCTPIAVADLLSGTNVGPAFYPNSGSASTAQVPTLVAYIQGATASATRHARSSCSTRSPIARHPSAFASAPEVARWLFAATARPGIDVTPVACDTGAVQIDSLHLDAGETIRRAAAFYQALDERARAEADLLRRHRIAPAWSRTRRRSAVRPREPPGSSRSWCRNFTWDWIYDVLRTGTRDAPGLRETLRQAYALASAGWRLPMHGGFETISPLVDLPFVARRARTRGRTCAASAACPWKRRSRCCPSAATGSGTSIC